VMFGYLYYWSGSLWTPIVGHCTNNSLTLIMFYLNNKGIIDIDPEDTSTIPLKFSLISGLVSISLMYLLYRNQFKKANDNN
jgi:membrane protease YdiL (CAAX protease family)